MADKVDQSRTVSIYVPGRPEISLRQFGLPQVIGAIAAHVPLAVQLSKREILARYRGSLLGFAWSFVTPMIMLAVYTFVFSVVFKTRWNVEVGNQVTFALILFAGLIVFNIFAECVSRAPGLMLENPSYIKRVIFPLEILPLVSLFTALFNAAVSFLILFVGYLLTNGLPPLTALWLPVVLLPFLVLLLGFTWILAPLGVYVRDVRQLVAVILPIFMFASPLFYPMSALPHSVIPFMSLNPLAFTIEQVRAVTLFGNAPDLLGLLIYLVVAIVVAWPGLVWFLLTKRGFADVV